MMKTTSLLLLLCCLLACKTKKTVDFNGTYVGDIRGNKLSMFLKVVDKKKIEGTIFDRGNNFIVTADIKDDLFKGQARDSSDMALFDIEGSFHGDTLIVMMEMQKPKKSPPFPVHFKKVFINKSVTDEGPVKDTPTNITENPSSGPQESQSRATMNNDKIFGMWEVKIITDNDVHDLFKRNKFLFFNVNGSYSVITNEDNKGNLTPVKGKSWFTSRDSLYIKPTNNNYPAENLGNYKVEQSQITIVQKDGKSITLQKL